jgi:hypothetical protein
MKCAEHAPTLGTELCRLGSHKLRSPARSKIYRPMRSHSSSMRSHSSSKQLSRDLRQSAVRPGDIPLGSMESRVAARAWASHLRASEGVVHVMIECIGSPERNWELFVPMKRQ